MSVRQLRTTDLLYVLAMVVTVVGADLLFLRDRFAARLLVNVFIVVAFAAFYLRFLKPRA